MTKDCDSDQERLLSGEDRGISDVSFPDYGTRGSSNINPQDLDKICNEDSGSTLPTESATIDTWPMFLINVLLAVITCADRSRTLVLGQYLYSRLASDIFGNVTIDTSSHPCMNTSSNMSIHVKEVQDRTSSMIMYFDLTTYALSVPANVVLGVCSSAMSRRVQMLIPTTGYVLRCASIFIVVVGDYNTNWLYLGCAAEGIVGGVPGIFLAVYLYTTDITPRDGKRTLGMALVEGFRGIVGAVVNVAAGHMIEICGFVVSSAFTLGFSVLGILLMTILPQRKPRVLVSQHASLNICSIEFLKDSIKTILVPFQSKKGSRVKWMAVMGYIAYFLSFTTTFGVEKVRLLYFMNMPFCWDAITIGWYQFGRQTAYNIFTLGSIPVLHRCMPGVFIGVLGAFTNMGEYLALSFASDNTLLYVALGMSVGQALPITIIRGETSRLFGSDAQGPLFAIMAAFESLSFMISTYMLAVYSATLNTFPGAVFLVAACIKVLVITHLIAFQVFWRKYTQLQSEEKLIKDKDDS